MTREIIPEFVMARREEAESGVSSAALQLLSAVQRGRGSPYYHGRLFEDGPRDKLIGEIDGLTVEILKGIYLGFTVAQTMINSEKQLVPEGTIQTIELVEYGTAQLKTIFVSLQIDDVYSVLTMNEKAIVDAIALTVEAYLNPYGYTVDQAGPDGLRKAASRTGRDYEHLKRITAMLSNSKSLSFFHIPETDLEKAKVSVDSDGIVRTGQCDLLYFVRDDSLKSTTYGATLFRKSTYPKLAEWLEKDPTGMVTASKRRYGGPYNLIVRHAVPESLKNPDDLQKYQEFCQLTKVDLDFDNIYPAVLTDRWRRPTKIEVGASSFILREEVTWPIQTGGSVLLELEDASDWMAFTCKKGETNSFGMFEGYSDKSISSCELGELEASLDELATHQDVAVSVKNAGRSVGGLRGWLVRLLDNLADWLR